MTAPGMPIGPTPRTRVRRLPARGSYDRDVINAILDEALVCHVGFVDEGQPIVIPTIHVRIGDRVHLHGSNASRMLVRLREGVPACVTVTLLDGLVLARSAFHHSMNYRSVVIFGRAEETKGREQKLEVFERLVEHVVRGRWADARRPSEEEINATTLVSLPITEASAKIRCGPAKDDEEDYSLPIWAGVIPLELRAATPLADEKLAHSIPTPDYVTLYQRYRTKKEPGLAETQAP